MCLLWEIKIQVAIYRIISISPIPSLTFRSAAWRGNGHRHFYCVPVLAVLPFLGPTFECRWSNDLLCWRNVHGSDVCYSPAGVLKSQYPVLWATSLAATVMEASIRLEATRRGQAEAVSSSRLYLLSLGCVQRAGRPCGHKASLCFPGLHCLARQIAVLTFLNCYLIVTVTQTMKKIMRKNTWVSWCSRLMRE